MRKRYRPWEIIAKLREAEVLIGQGQRTPHFDSFAGQLTARGGVLTEGCRWVR
jgi:hypothetical protein